jgi:hypothetical protein
MVTLTQRVVPVVAAAFVALTLTVPAHAQRKTNILTAEEIEHAQVTASNAYDLVQMLRPRWLVSRGLVRVPMAPGEALQGSSVKVWINEHNVGDVEYLKTIGVERIQELRWYSPNEAGSRFGPTDDAAIEVTLKR